MTLGNITKLIHSYEDHHAERNRIIDIVSERLSRSLGIKKRSDPLCFYSLRTLSTLLRECDDTKSIAALGNWLYVSHTEADHRELRELAIYCRDLGGFIGKKMRMFILNTLRSSHPRFNHADLSELDEAEASSLRTVVNVLARVYDATIDPQRDIYWKTYCEDTDLFEQEFAAKSFGYPSGDLIDLIFEYEDRAGEIKDYLVSRQVRLSDADMGGLRAYLTSESMVLAEGAL